jgi:hypothetical protein
MEAVCSFETMYLPTSPHGVTIQKTNINNTMKDNLLLYPLRQSLNPAMYIMEVLAVTGKQGYYVVGLHENLLTISW